MKDFNHIKLKEKIYCNSNHRRLNCDSSNLNTFFINNYNNQQKIDSFVKKNNQSDCDENVLVIIGCSKKKLHCRVPVKSFYTGQLFKMIKNLAEKNSFRYIVISGKYGLLYPNDVISPYDQKLKDNKCDILRVQKLTNNKLKQLILKYDKIIVFIGKIYQKVIKPLFNEKFYIIYDAQGLMKYLSLLSYYNKISTERFLREIEKFKYKG